MSVSEHQYQGILQVIERLGSGLDSRKIRELAGLELLKLLRADYFASFTWSPDERRFGGHVFINMDPQNLERYSSYYQFHNPLSATVQKLRRAVRVNEIMPQRELIRTEFYNDFLARDGLYYGLNLYVHDGDINIADMRIWRNRRRENFDDADLQILEAYPPGVEQGILFTSPTVTVCLPGGWVRIMGPKGWAVPSFRCQAARRKSRSSSLSTWSRPLSWRPPRTC
jgi:hypothetical protein